MTKQATKQTNTAKSLKSDVVSETQGSEVTETAVTTIDESTGEIMDVKPKYVPKIVRVLTKALFKWVPNQPKYYTITGAMFTGKAINEGAGKSKKEPAVLMFVTDLETGLEGQTIVSAVLKSILTEEYPDNSYVGKSFTLKMHKIPGKEYNGFEAIEIEA